jgi:alcohol dehydrogenase class IV
VVARLLTDQPHAAAEDGVEWVGALCRKLAIPSLRTYGLSREDIPGLVERATQTNSMKGNPIALTPEELARIVEQAL